MRSRYLCGILVLLSLVETRANPVITEFMASNQSTVADEDGDFSDWIEVHNPTSAAISLNQWALTDSKGTPGKWRFPDITLQPGEFRVIWASGKNRREAGQALHTNFSLSADGEYLGLVRPDGTVEQAFDEYAAQRGDESFGAQFSSTTLLTTGAQTRFLAPTGAASPGSNWNQQSFSDAAWLVGYTGFGHGLTVPGITIRHVFKNGTMNGTLADADNLLNLPPGSPGILAEATVVSPVANILGEGSDGRFGFNSTPPAGTGDHYAIKLTGWVEIVTPGVYTFGTNSDDGVRVRINGSDLIVDNTSHGPQDNFGSRNLTAGLHSFEVVMFEGAGGDCLEFFAAPGSYSSWNADVFRLVGDTANGGLAASTAQQGTGGFIATNSQPYLAGSAGAYFRTPFNAALPGSVTALSLVTRHNDGFAAWLNGTAVASHNAPSTPQWDSVATAARGNSESLRPMGFNLTSYLPLIANGSNLLAIHGMKTAVGDTSFLLAPELIAGSIDSAVEPAFYGPGKSTPGWINGEPSSLGKVADTSFSVDRGFYTSPISLVISSATPGATIKYTIDGSTPSSANGLTYTGPVAISTTTTIRACAIKEDWESTDVDTQTYLFLNDVITQSTSPAGWPATSGTSQKLDLGMDPDIVNHSNPNVGGPTSVKAALASLPAVCLTTDQSNLFNIGGSQGIYSNPNGRGLAWERPASIEWINPPGAGHPNGTSEFQVNAGIRIRGGYSRSTDNPKHSFRVFFREEYGASKLDYPLFGHRGAQEFDKIDFRTSQNYSWSFHGDDQNTFLREESTRQAYLDMQQPGSRVRYFHLYLNGQYWGLFNLDERTEAAFSESYLGGDKDDYDVVKAEGDAGFTVGATDGSLGTWQELFNKGETHRANPTNANYFRMMGLAADGVTPTADPVLLDPANLVDYMLLTFWSGNLDGCTSAFLGNDKANNWSGSRRRENNPGVGFKFFVHDFEHSLFNVNEDRTGPFNFANETDFNFSNPAYLHQDLMGNAEYRMLWADRAQKHMFNGGALHPTTWSNRVNKFAGIVDQAIIAESARWGDAAVAAPRTKLNWENAQNNLLGYFAPRNPVVLAQLRADGLYPSIDAPTISPFGGYQQSGVEAVLNGPPSTTLHYMPDGSDPRAVGGALRAGALTYTASTSSQFLIGESAGGWRYLYDGTNQGTAWRTPTFNDSTWPVGTAELGYGDNDEATTIPIHYVSPGVKAATAYFRKTFTVTNRAEISNLLLMVEYDDTMAVYLNGTRVAGNLPMDPAYNFYSGSGTTIEDLRLSTNVSPSLLVDGTNVIAVEVHQSVPESSDLSMNLSLAATRSTTPTPLFLTGTGEKILRVRARNSSNTWSAMSEASFLLETEAASPQNLAISEILYHPLDPSPAEVDAGFDDANDFEFVELLNTGTRHVDLQGVYIYGAITFDFTGAVTGRTLAPGARILIAADPEAFAMRYGPGKPVAGKYSGQLNNAGESVILYTPGDEVIRSVTYSDTDPWPAAADGEGYSLVRRHPNDPTGDSDAEGWGISGSVGGSPGEADVPSEGSFEAWAASAFTPEQRASSAISGLSVDPDGDGRLNFEEFAFATQPMVYDEPDAQFVWVGSGSTRQAALRLRRPEITSNITYELMGADEPGGGWSTIATAPIDSISLGSGIEHAIFTDGIPVTESRKFLRMRVSWVP